MKDLSPRILFAEERAGVSRPLFLEPSFRNTLVLTALLALVASALSERVAESGLAWLLPLGAAYVGSARDDGILRLALRFAVLGAAAPAVLGLGLARHLGAPGLGVPLLQAASLVLAIAGIAALERVSRPGDREPASSAILVAGAPLAFLAGIGVDGEGSLAPFVLAWAGIALCAGFGGQALRRLRYRSFRAPRAASAALVLAAAIGVLVGLLERS